MLVTHDPVEAMLMADRIACLVDGRIVQLGTPEGLWRDPAHPFVALSLTGAQLISGKAIDGRVETSFGTVVSSTPLKGDVIVSVRKVTQRLFQANKPSSATLGSAQVVPSLVFDRATIDY